MRRKITFFWHKFRVNWKPSASWLLLYLCIAMWSSVGYTTIKAQPSDIQKKMGQLDKSLIALEEKIKLSQQALSKEEKALVEIDTSIHATLIQMQSLENEMSMSAKAIQQLNREILALKNQHQQKVHALISYLHSQQKNQDNHKLKRIFNQKSIHDMVILNKHYGSFSSALTQEIQQTLKSLKNLAQQQESLHNKKAELQNLADQLSAKKEEFNKKKLLQKKSIMQFQTSIQKNLDAKKTLSDEKQTLNKLLKEIQIALEKQKKEAIERQKRHQQDRKLGTSNTASNFTQENAKEISNTTGFATMLGRLPPPLKNSKLNHQKNSYFLAKEGSVVQAIYPGKVVFSEWLKGIGLLLIVDHGNGFMTLYGNNQVLYKKTGDWVNLGDTIALVGKSGGQAESGLYFEIRKNGQPLQPNRWIDWG